MTYVWKGCDDLINAPAADVDWNNEWSLNAHLGRRIRRLWPRTSPFEFESSWPLMDKRLTPRSQPPTPDFSILSRNNARSASLDFDGKVIRHDKDIDAYLTKITESFFTGRYSGGASSGAMIAYINRGTGKVFAKNIGTALKKELLEWELLSPREHYISGHERTSKRGAQRPSEFSLHHLLMELYQAVPPSGLKV